MADVEAIASGIAALLRDVYAADEGHVSATFQEAPQPPTLQVVGVERMVPLDFGGGADWTFLVEAYMGLITEKKAHKRLYQLLSDDAVWDAIESDNARAGALFSRLSDSGTVTTDPDEPAADSVAVIEYRGASRVERGAVQALTGTWAVRVIA